MTRQTMAWYAAGSHGCDAKIEKPTCPEAIFCRDPPICPLFSRVVLG